MLDFRILSFLSVAKHLNFTEASKELCLSQPAVSQHIKYIEDMYNCTLFIREHKKIRLTTAGEILYSALKTMKNDENKLKNLIRESAYLSEKTCFGITMTLGEYTFTDSLIKFIKSNVNTNFHIFYNNTTALLNDLDNGKIDFAIIEGSVNSKHYKVSKIKSDEFIAVTSSSHSFKKEVKTIADLRNEKLIVTEKGSGTLAMLSNILNVQNLSINDFKNIIEVNNMHIVVELLKNDCGITFLYSSAVEKELKEGILQKIELDDVKIYHDFSFVCNRNSLFANYYQSIFEEFFKI